MGGYYDLAYHHYAGGDGEHVNNPYRVVYTPGSRFGPVQLVEGSMQSEYAASVEPATVLADDRWREHLRHADAEWLVPFLERMADGETFTGRELLWARHDRDARRWAAARNPTALEDEADVIDRFGLPPDPADVSAIRVAARTELDGASPNGAVLRAYCVQLFAHADPSDALLIDRARKATPGGVGGIGLRLRYGAGIEATKAYLRGESSPAARSLLGELEEHERVFGYDDWTPGETLAEWHAYYDQSVGGQAAALR